MPTVDVDRPARENYQGHQVWLRNDEWFLQSVDDILCNWALLDDGDQSVTSELLHQIVPEDNNGIWRQTQRHYKSAVKRQVYAIPVDQEEIPAAWCLLALCLSHQDIVDDSFGVFAKG